MFYKINFSRSESQQSLCKSSKDTQTNRGQNKCTDLLQAIQDHWSQLAKNLEICANGAVKL